MDPNEWGTENQTEVAFSTSVYQEAVALTVGSVLRGTIVNDVIFIGHRRGQSIHQQPIKRRHLGLSHVGLPSSPDTSDSCFTRPTNVRAQTVGAEFTC